MNTLALERIWRRLTRRGAPLRGRVHKVSIVAGGEVSVVLRFGLDEPAARKINQGELVGLVLGEPAPPATQENGS